MFYLPNNVPIEQRFRTQLQVIYFMLIFLLLWRPHYNLSANYQAPDELNQVSEKAQFSKAGPRYLGREL